jgi:hypothetical protein
MRKRGLLWSITAVALAVVVSAAMPAFGAPSPLSIAKRALGIAKKADKRSKRALRLALRVPAKGPKGDKGDKGAKGDKGDQGPAGTSALDAVPSGKTIHGVVGGDFHAFDNTASDFGVDVTLPIPAANNLSDSDVFVNVSGWQDAGGQSTPTTSDTNAGCSGTPAAPTAPAGKVCIYVSGADHAFNLAGQSVLFGTGASPYGFKLKWDASATGDTFVDATWAYKAP